MNAELAPILSTLCRSKGGALLIVVQVALALAIVCNSLSIIQQSLEQMSRPSGLDEANTFTLTNRWIGAHGVSGEAGLLALARADIAAMAAIPGVLAVAATNSFPLRGYGVSWNVALSPDQRTPTERHVALYMPGEEGAAAFDLRLIAGRWFRADEIRAFQVADFGRALAGEVIITRHLADRLFPQGGALGRTLYLGQGSDSAARIIGIVRGTQTPWGTGEDSDLPGLPAEDSMFLPYQYVGGSLAYLVRTRPHRLAQVMAAAPDKLFALSSARILDDVQSFHESRAELYRQDRALTLTLGLLSALMLTVTACGIISLTSYWVTQRRRQIGTRRALGARRIDILRYFHLENLLLIGAGCVLGIVAAVGLNLSLAGRLQIHRLDAPFVGLGALSVLLISQAAVLWPALRAASVPPAVATRNI